MAAENQTQKVTRYLYKTQRVNGKVIRKYIGKADSPMACLMVQKNRLQRAKQQSHLAEVRKEQAHFKELCQVIRLRDQLVRRARKIEAETPKRSNNSALVQRRPNMNGAKQTIPMSPTAEPPAETVSQEQILELHGQAKRGDQASAAQLREIIQNNDQLRRTMGNLTQHVERAVIRLITDNDPAYVEAMRLQLVEMRRSLLGTGEPSETEKLLIDDIVLLWLESSYTRLAALQPQQHIRDARFWEDRTERAHTRYLNAIDQLHSWRKPAKNSAEKSTETTTSP